MSQFPSAARCLHMGTDAEDDKPGSCDSPPPHCFSLLDFHVGIGRNQNVASVAPRMSAAQGVSMFVV